MTGQARNEGDTAVAGALPSIGSSPTSQQLAAFQRSALRAGRRLVVGALIADSAGRVYVQRRSQDRALFPGRWDIVGGHVDAGEALLAALAREVDEETGWRLARTGAVVEILDWSAGDGVPRREIDLLVEVEGDLTAPRLEAGKHDAGLWLSPEELPLLLEGRGEEDRWVHDTVAKAFELLGEAPMWRSNR